MNILKDKLFLNGPHYNFHEKIVTLIPFLFVLVWGLFGFVFGFFFFEIWFGFVGRLQGQKVGAKGWGDKLKHNA